MLGRPGFAWAPVLGFQPEPFAAWQLTLHNPVCLFPEIALNGEVMSKMSEDERQELIGRLQTSLLMFCKALHGMTAEELGNLLDVAVQVRRVYTLTIQRKLGSDEVVRALRDPGSLDVETAKLWIVQIQQAIPILGKNPKTKHWVTGLSVWFYSLLACTYPELRSQGREMWQELGRGARDSKEFDQDSEGISDLGALS